VDSFAPEESFGAGRTFSDDGIWDARYVMGRPLSLVAVTVLSERLYMPP
jgi:hypothetical protein